MRALVTGAAGQLGHDMVEELRARGWEAVGLSHKELDIRDEDMVRAAVLVFAPDVLFHCAAYTAVEAAELNMEECMAVNARGTENIARACGEQGCKLVYPSTDYVFDGTGTRPWSTRDLRCPLNVYGRSKYFGELAVQRHVPRSFIVRISWIFGAAGHNFVKIMLALAETKKRIMVVNDQIGTPTYTRDLAALFIDMAETERFGTYHATNSGGYISWYDLACEVFRQAGVTGAEVVPVTTAEFAAAVRRPLNSRMSLDTLKLNGFEPMPDWRDALSRYLTEIGVK